ncbi:MAG: DUF4097 family beta strand repeat protein [Myxococcales bacterium]|nr:DUF4097 family beta strand repeat protein [Myxococcales bacterium]
MRALIPTLLAASLGLACALGFRGATEVDAEYSLDEIDAVRVNLPDTPISVLGDPEATTLSLEGVWYSVGGSRTVAADNSTIPLLNFALEGRFAELTAIIPTANRDLVDLEVRSLTLPPDRDLEIWTGLGDIEVAQVEGNVSIDVEAGHVTVFGGAEGVAIRTGAGDVEVETSGNTTAATDSGDVVIAQLGAGGNDLVITTGFGSIDVTLRSDANLDLDLKASGDIRVQTRTVSTVTSGAFQRAVGNGNVKVWLSARGGDVTVRLDESL